MPQASRPISTHLSASFLGVCACFSSSAQAMELGMEKLNLIPEVGVALLPVNDKIDGRAVTLTGVDVGLLAGSDILMFDESETALGTVWLSSAAGLRFTTLSWSKDKYDISAQELAFTVVGEAELTLPQFPTVHLLGGIGADFGIDGTFDNSLPSTSGASTKSDATTIESFSAVYVVGRGSYTLAEDFDALLSLRLGSGSLEAKTRAGTTAPRASADFSMMEVHTGLRLKL